MGNGMTPSSRYHLDITDLDGDVEEVFTDHFMFINPETHGSPEFLNDRGGFKDAAEVVYVNAAAVTTVRVRDTEA